MLFWYILIFVSGLILGSYLNSWIWRYHSDKKGFSERSICVHCNRTLAWYENIPLVSFLYLHGKCSTCKKPIPPDYFLVELMTGLLFISVAFVHVSASIFEPWHFFRDIFFTALLIVIFVYDYKYYLISPPLVLSGAIIAGFFNYRYSMFSIRCFTLGILVATGFFLLQYLVSRGRWIGEGDIYLGVFMGALLGSPNVLVALFVAYILGALSAIPLLLFQKKNMNSEVPFGTFLTVGTFVAMLWGETILKWYLGLIRI